MLDPEITDWIDKCLPPDVRAMIKARDEPPPPPQQNTSVNILLIIIND
jgi:hypothetical protein